MARINMPHPFSLRVENGFEIPLRKGVNDIDDKYADHWVVKKFLVDDQNAPIDPPAEPTEEEKAAAETAAQAAAPAGKKAKSAA